MQSFWKVCSPLSVGIITTGISTTLVGMKSHLSHHLHAFRTIPGFQTKRVLFRFSSLRFANWIFVKICFVLMRRTKYRCFPVKFVFYVDSVLTPAIILAYLWPDLVAFGLLPFLKNNFSIITASIRWILDRAALTALGFLIPVCSWAMVLFQSQKC